MRNKLIVAMLTAMLLLTSMPALFFAPIASATSLVGPSITIDDSINRVNATIGVKSGSQITAKGTITNIGGVPLLNLLTGVYFIESVPGCVPGDFSFEFSFDCVAWSPIDPSEVKPAPPAASPWTVELIIGPFGGQTLNPGDSIILYLKMTFNDDLTPYSNVNQYIRSMAVLVFQDSDGDRTWDGPPTEMLFSQPPWAAGVIDWDNPVRIDLAIVHTTEIDGTGKFYYSIQSAISAATPGQTIYVYPGTYNENLVVNKALTIQGANKDTTIIQGQPGGSIAIGITASNVAISGFTINGYTATQATPGSTGWGVYAYGSLGSHYSNINIVDNILTFLSQSGIQLGYVDGSLVEDNVFKRETRLVWYKPPGATPGSYINVTRGGAGPALWYCTNVTIDPNVIQTDGVGIFLYSSSDVLIEANVISAPDTTNASDTGIHVQGCTMISIVRNNVFNFTAGPKSSYNWGTNGAGINIIGSQNINVRNNFLHDNTVGVLVTRLDLAPEPRKVDIHYNCFKNNTQFGVLNCYQWIGKNQTYTPASYVADACSNWWGDSTGPYHPTKNPSGLGNQVSDYVLFEPWLKAYFDYFRHNPVVGEPVTFDASLSIQCVRTIVSYTWNFDDSNTTTTTNPIIIHAFAAPRTYNVTLTLTYDDNTTGTQWASVHVAKMPYFKVKPENVQLGLINKTCQVNVTINDLDPNLGAVAYEFRLVYNATLLQVINVTEGPFLAQFNQTSNPPYTLFMTFTESGSLYGTNVLVGVVIWPNGTGVYPGQFPQGNGTIATITFKAIYQEKGYDVIRGGFFKPPQTCNLTLIETLIVDNTLNRIPHHAEQGQYSIMPNNVADLNWDGKVRVDDILLAITAFGSDPSKPNWNPNADINCDNKVRVDDLLNIALNFGWIAVDC